eukprot:3795454-Prorocentrum_lima.AAC.1
MSSIASPPRSRPSKKRTAGAHACSSQKLVKMGTIAARRSSHRDSATWASTSMSDRFSRRQR